MTESKARNYAVVESLDSLCRLRDVLMENEGFIGYDIETGYHGPDREKGALFPHSGAFTAGFSITNDPSWARYVPLRHDYIQNLDWEQVWEIMHPVLTSGRVVCHHAKFEAKFCRKDAGYDLVVAEDTMLDAYVLAEWQTTALKELVLRIFGHRMVEIQELFPKATAVQLRALRFNVLPLTAEVVSYACEDAAWTLALRGEIGPRARQRDFMWRLEHEISNLMVDVEWIGTSVDWQGIASSRAYAEPFLAKWEQSVKAALGEMAGRSLLGVNLNSAKQMQHLLYNELGLKTTRMTAGTRDMDEDDQKMSTDAIALETLAQEHRPIKLLLQLREIENLRNRHVKWLGEKPGEIPIRAKDGRVRANYAQTVVGSGRFAAGDPAIQQLPKNWFWALGEWGEMHTNAENPEEAQAKIIEQAPEGSYWTGNYRDFIIASPGTYYIGYDYGQVEVRMLAGLSQEPTLIKGFNEDADTHTLTAAMMFGKTPAQVTKEDRDRGKTINFALLYGLGIKSLAERLGTTVEKAQELYDSYFDGYTCVREWVAKTKSEGKENGWVETPFGRKVTVWELQSDNKGVRSKGERLLVNAPVQGGAADYMKIAMVRARKALIERGWWMTLVKMVLNLHDALTFEVDESLDPAEVRAVLEPAIVFPVAGFPKMVADWELGYNWGSASKWKTGLKPVFGESWRLVKEDAPTPPPTPVEAVEATETASEPERHLRLVHGLDDSEGRTLTIKIDAMPTEDQFARFLSLMNSRPGDTVVEMETPQGNIRLSQKCGLGPEDGAWVSMILTGAETYVREEDVNVSALMKGLAL